MPTKKARTVPLALCLLLSAVALAAGCGGGEPTQTAGAPSAGAEGAKAAGKKGKSDGSALVAYQTGLQFLLRGDPRKAQAELRRATELDPKMSEAFYELGKLEVHLSSQNVGSQARDLDVLDRGIEALDRARALEPNNDQYWFWCGRARFLKNQPDAALEFLAKAVELNPKHAGAWKALGLAQHGLSKTDEAKASFGKAIEADPTDAGARFQLGQMLELQSDLAGARAAYEKSIELDPTEPEVFGRLMQVCSRLGDAEGEARAKSGMDLWTEYDAKLNRRRRAVNQKPGDPVALRALGEMYFQVGKWEEALEWFVKSIHIDPKDGLTHLYCGIARRHLQDYANAANHLKEAEFLAPDNLDPKLELLRLYAETKDEDGAKAVVASIETEAAGEFLWALAEVCQEIGRAEDAARLFDAARAKGVTSAPAADAPAAATDEGQ